MELLPACLTKVSKKSLTRENRDFQVTFTPIAVAIVEHRPFRAVDVFAGARQIRVRDSFYGLNVRHNRSAKLSGALARPG
jgi:hypothetical protein